MPKIKQFLVRLPKAVENAFSSIFSNKYNKNTFLKREKYDTVPKYEEEDSEELSSVEKDNLEEDENENQDLEEKPRETSNLQAAWNISNLIQGKF